MNQTTTQHHDPDAPRDHGEARTAPDHGGSDRDPRAEAPVRTPAAEDGRGPDDGPDHATPGDHEESPPRTGTPKAGTTEDDRNDPEDGRDDDPEAGPDAPNLGVPPGGPNPPPGPCQGPPRPAGRRRRSNKSVRGSDRRDRPPAREWAPRFVTKGFHDELVEALVTGEVHPAWASGPEGEARKRALFSILVYPHEDEDGRGVLFPIDRFRAVMGWKPGSLRKDTSLLRFLGDLQDDLPPGHLVIEPYVPPDEETGRGKATAIRIQGISPSLVEAAEREAVPRKAERLVRPGTGEFVGVSRARKVARDEALSNATFAEDTPLEIRRLVEYLHARPPRAFSKRAGAAAEEVAGELARVKGHWSETKWHVHAGAWRSVFHQPVPVYRTSERTQRLVPVGQGLANAPSWIRQAVLADAFEVDMKAAQLALVAALWDVPEIEPYLVEAETSVWDALVGHLFALFPHGVYDPEVDFDTLKPILKTTMYQATFGATRETLQRFGNSRGMSPSEHRAWREGRARVKKYFAAKPDEVAVALLAHPVFEALLEAREVALREIERAGRSVDVFGREYVLGSYAEGELVDARSALAGEVQAAEAFVMLRVARPFVVEAERVATVKGRQPEAQILLWQSDGLTFAPRRTGGEGPWLERAAEGLRDGCRDLEDATGCREVLTGLEVKYRPTPTR